MAVLEERPRGYVPTVEEIKAAAAKIREGWTEEEHMKRKIWAYDMQYNWDYEEPAKVA